MIYFNRLTQSSHDIETDSNPPSHRGREGDVIRLRSEAERVAA